jgi:hypothetical protein
MNQFTERKTDQKSNYFATHCTIYQFNPHRAHFRNMETEVPKSEWSEVTQTIGSCQRNCTKLLHNTNGFLFNEEMRCELLSVNIEE